METFTIEDIPKNVWNNLDAFEQKILQAIFEMNKKLHCHMFLSGYTVNLVDDKVFFGMHSKMLKRARVENIEKESFGKSLSRFLDHFLSGETIGGKIYLLTPHRYPFTPTFEELKVFVLKDLSFRKITRNEAKVLNKSIEKKEKEFTKLVLKTKR